MANLTISIPHQLTRAEVKRRIDEGVVRLHGQSQGMLGPINTRWQGDVLEFDTLPMGQRVAGWITVEDQFVRVEVELPWFLAALAGTVRQQVEQQGRLLLERR